MCLQNVEKLMFGTANSFFQDSEHGVVSFMIFEIWGFVDFLFEVFQIELKQLVKISMFRGKEYQTMSLCVESF